MRHAMLQQPNLAKRNVEELRTPNRCYYPAALGYFTAIIQITGALPDPKFGSIQRARDRF